MNDDHKKLKELVDQLQAENKTVFEYIEEYITESGLYDQKTSQPLLADIATHFVEAEKQGIKAKEIVGNDPEKYCRELGRNLPRKPGAYRQLLVLAIAWTIITLLAVITLVLELQGNHQPVLYATSLALFPLSIGLFAALTPRDTTKNISAVKVVGAFIATILIAAILFWVFGFVMTEGSMISYITSVILDGLAMVVLWRQVLQHRATT